MIDGLIEQALLKVRARLGTDGEVVTWLVVAGVLGLFALVFLSIALYQWLATLYGAALAALAVGALQAVIAASALARSVAVRNRNRRVAQQRLALAAAAKAKAWPLDPQLLAIGLEIGKTIGWRKLLPIAAVGIGILVTMGAVGAARKQATPEPVETETD